MMFSHISMREMTLSEPISLGVFLLDLRYACKRQDGTKSFKFLLTVFHALLFAH